MNETRPVAVFMLSHPWMQAIVQQAAPADMEVRFVDPQDTAAIERVLPDADFLMTVTLPAAWVPLLRRCKLVQHQGVGYDGIDVAALKRAGIPLALTPEGTTVGVAEHTILLILALYKQLVPVHESMRAGQFDSLGWRADSHFFDGKTLGLVGLGRIGRRVAHLAQAFGARLLYFDVMRAPVEAEQALGIRYVAFRELLAASDVVSVHTPLTPETQGLFNAATFACMKRGALFINTSRGGTYDMDALYRVLHSGHLGGAGLDVFNPEPPPPDHPLLQLPNVICTPHMATGTVEAHLQKAAAQFRNFRRVWQGETADNLVDISTAAST